MSRFRSLVKTQGFPALVFQHGEPFVYLQRGVDPRPITGVVTRDENQIISELGDAVQASAIVSILDDSTLGISRAELDSQKDFVLLAYEQGGEPVKRAIVKVLNDKVGRIRLAIY